MIKRRTIRLTLGALLGAAAGLSLTSTVLPTVLSTLGMGESFLIRFQFAGYAAHSVMIWGVGGWGAAKMGTGRFGAAILGVVGVASGAVFGYLAIGSEPSVLLATALAGGAYGAIGGLLIAGILPGEGDASAPGR